jgi:hypothetical protein
LFSLCWVTLQSVVVLVTPCCCMALGIMCTLATDSILLFPTCSCEIHRASEANFFQKRPREGLYHSHTGVRKRTGRTRRDRVRSRRPARASFSRFHIGKSGRNRAGGHASREREDRAHGGAKSPSRERHRNEALKASSCDGEKTGRAADLSPRSSSRDWFL